MGKNFRNKKGVGTAVSRARRKQAEEIKAETEGMKAASMEAARQEIARLGAAKANRSQDAALRWKDSLLNSVVRGASAVMKSRHLNQPILASISSGPKIVAYTDFNSVVLQWPSTNFPDMLDSQDKIRLVVSQMKGALEHEIGHVRFTIPFLELMTSTRDVDAAWDGRHTTENLQKVWNAIEDQRMEVRVVRAVPRIASYFIPMVNEVILSTSTFDVDPVALKTSWLLLAGRDYLDDNVRDMSHNLFEQHIVDTMGFAGAADTWYDIVCRYSAATDEMTLWGCVVDAADFLKHINIALPQDDSHGRQQKSGNSAEDGASDVDGQGGAGEDGEDGEPCKACGGTGEDEDGEECPACGGTGEEGEGEGDDGEGEGDGEGDKPGKDGNEPTSHKDHYKDRLNEPKKAPKKAKQQKSAKWKGGQSNHGSKGGELFAAEELKKAMVEAAKEAKAKTVKDPEVQQAIMDAFTFNDQDGLSEYVGAGVMMSPSDQAEAMGIATGIEEALNSFVSASAPIWHNRVEQGYIDALSYRTKDIGSQDFHRHLENSGTTGLDVHVSVLADVSYSMQGYMGELSKFMYASAIACQNLGISSTFTLWSDANASHRIWSNGISPEEFPAMGGTDPTEALDDLDLHNTTEKGKHLILVFTDGAWAHGFPSLQRWATDERVIVFLRYGYGAESGLDMGADRSVAIRSLAELPQQLLWSLIDVLSEKE